MTSIAAAWMNIVYGFLGLRSDRTPLAINPSSRNVGAIIRSASCTITVI